MNNTAIQHGPPLSTSFGYGIVLGLGMAFALGMIGTTWALRRFVPQFLLCWLASLLELTGFGSSYQNEVQTSEMFSTAGRTVKTGLVASAVVSSWTW